LRCWKKSGATLVNLIKLWRLAGLSNPF
jgi:hypothetical protein